MAKREGTRKRGGKVDLLFPFIFRQEEQTRRECRPFMPLEGKEGRVKKRMEETPPSFSNKRGRENLTTRSYPADQKGKCTGKERDLSETKGLRDIQHNNVFFLPSIYLIKFTSLEKIEGTFFPLLAAVGGGENK